MTLDPIIDEVRAIRDSIAKEHGYDLDSIFRMLTEADARSGLEHVSPTPAKVELAPAAVQGQVAAVPLPRSRG